MYFPESKWINDHYDIFSINATKDSYTLLFRVKGGYITSIDAFILNSTPYNVIFIFKLTEEESLNNSISKVLSLIYVDDFFGKYIKSKFNDYIYDTIAYSIPEHKLYHDKEFILNNEKAFILINIGKEMISYIIIDKKKAKKYKKGELV